MKKIFSIIVITGICLTACTPELSEESSNKIVYFTEKDLPEPFHLKGEKYNIPEMISPRGIFLKDGLAVVFERKNVSNEKFHVIDLVSKSLIRSKGIDGMGPGEVSVITQIEDAGEKDKVWAFDPELRIFSKFDLRDTSKLAETQMKSPETSYFLTNASWTSESTLLGNSVDGWTKYLHLTADGDSLALFGDWKDMINGKEFPGGLKPEELNANLVSNIFQGPMKGSPDKKHYVKVGMSIDYIDIINLEDESILTVYGPRQEIPYFKIGYSFGYQMPDFGANATERYLDVFAGKKSFFVLFFGKAYRELSDTENLNRIFEFDYEGNILNQYQLDFPIYGFAVDEENRGIYAVTLDEEPNLVRFDY